MTKALLINPGFELGNLIERDNFVFPFGLGYIASYAIKNNYEIEIWDIYAQKITFAEVKEEIENFNFYDYDIIGITGIVNQYLYVKQLVDLIKKKTNIQIVMGGPLASYSWSIVLKNTLVDICVIGEGEKTFLKLLNKIDLSLIKGIAYKIDGNVIKNDECELIKNLDEIGYPAFHLFDMEFYITHTGMMQVVRPSHKNKRVMALITSRGCPYDCKFCSKSMKGIRKKSIDFLSKEIKYYKDELRVEAIHFVDELLLLNKKRFFKFCQMIKKYNILWDCQGRINHVDEFILKSMIAANGICIGFGIESGSQKILDAMDKRVKAKDIEKTLLICLQIHLPVKIQLIFGYPGENWETINETIALFSKLRLRGRRFGVITPLPGSPLYEEAKKDGFIGETENDRIREEDYLEFLSRSGGWVSQDLFYNRTEFSDDDFYRILTKVENKIFNNFLKVIISHPFYITRHLKLYQLYLRNWFKYYKGRIKIFNIPKFITQFITNPKRFLKRVLNYIR